MAERMAVHVDSQVVPRVIGLCESRFFLQQIDFVCLGDSAQGGPQMKTDQKSAGLLEPAGNHKS